MSLAMLAGGPWPGVRQGTTPGSDSWFGLNVRWTGASAWPTANLAIYVPLRVPRRVTVVKLWVGVFTGNAGSFDVGVFSSSGVKLVSSGSTAKTAAGSGSEQVVDVTDTTLGPGLFYMGVSTNSSADVYIHRSSTTAPMPTAFGVLTEASAFPLPATATWVQNQTNTYVPASGILIETTVA